MTEYPDDLPDAKIADLGWTAVEGAANEKLAKALKDYAEEETQRIDAELKRRTMDSKV